MSRRPPRSTRTYTLFPDTTLCRSRLHLVLVVPQVREIAVGDEVERMAGRAHFEINLEPALGGRPVVGPEDAVEAPVHLRRLRRLPGRERRAGGDDAEAKSDGQRRGLEHTHLAHALSIGFAAAPPGNGPAPLSLRTASLMLFGSGSGRSSSPRSRSPTWKR